MNRNQWLHVWGLRPVAAPDRRKQPSSSTQGSPFAVFMRRLSDRRSAVAERKEASDCLAD